MLVDEEHDVVIRPTRECADGAASWLLTPRVDQSGKVATKMRTPERRRAHEPRVHPDRDRFYVLEGTVRLQLGNREMLVRGREAASFRHE